MRDSHCTVAAMVLAFASAAVAGEPSGARGQTQPDAARFTVFLQAAPVGTIEVSVKRGPEGIVISGTSRIGPPIALIVRSAEIRYDAEWKPVECVVDALVRDQPNQIRTKFAGGTAESEVTQPGSPPRKKDPVAPDTIVLPNLFYGAYEALAARLSSAKAGAELRGYIVPQQEIVIRVTAVTEERIEAPGRSVATRHYQLSFVTSTAPIEVDLWSDLSGRLVRLSVPGQSLDVVRADVATVAARREVTSRLGDELVHIPANGFVLGATVSRPSGSPKTGTVKLPVVVLVAGSSSASRDEAVINFPIFAEIAGALADAGFLVVRYDRRGTGDSGGRVEAATMVDYADDADAVVRYVEKRKDVDKRRIALAAHGDGTWTALIAAARDSRIAALALIGGAGTTGTEHVLDLQQRALERMSITDAEKQNRVELQKKIVKAVIAGTGWEDVPADMRKQADTPWFQSFLMFDPAKVMPRTKQPMLILRGALDTQVSAAESEKLAALARARKGPAGKAVQSGVLTGLNHLLVPATTGEMDEYASLTDRHVGKEVLDKLIAWLKATSAEPGKQ